MLLDNLLPDYIFTFTLDTTTPPVLSSEQYFSALNTLNLIASIPAHLRPKFGAIMFLLLFNCLLYNYLTRADTRDYALV